MNINHIVTLAFLAVCGLSACSQDKEVPGDSMTHRAVRLHVGISQPETSRASHLDDASTLKEFGLSLTNHHATEGASYSYMDMKISQTGNQAWDCYKPLYWQNATQPVDVEAHAPYSTDYRTDENSKRYLFFAPEQLQTATSYASDLLVYSQRGVVPGELDNETLNLQFRHVMSQLVLRIKINGETPAANPLKYLSISKIFIDCAVYIDEQPAKVLPLTNMGSVQPYETAFDAASGTVTYTCMLVPQESTFMLRFKYNGDTYRWTPAQPVKLESGKLHILDLTFDPANLNPAQLTSVRCADLNL